MPFCVRLFVGGAAEMGSKLAGWMKSMFRVSFVWWKRNENTTARTRSHNNQFSLGKRTITIGIVLLVLCAIVCAH